MRRRLLAHKKSTPEEVVLIWNDPVVELSYEPEIAPNDGGTMIPIVTWYQTAYYSNDETKTVVETITQDTAVDYSYGYTSIGYIDVDSSSGIVIVGSTVSESERTLGTVTVTVTSNGRTGTGMYEIRQEAYIGGEPEPESLPMDVILWCSSDRHMYYVSKDYWTADRFPVKEYTPLGIVVIPASHNRYGDTNTMGVMAMMAASINSPKNGNVNHSNPTSSSDTLLPYGVGGADTGSANETVRTFTIASIPYNVIGDTIYGDYQGSLSGSSNIVYFPSDLYVDDNGVLPNTIDTETYYPISTMQYGAPSPYNDGQASGLYGSDQSSSYCFSSFDGNERSFDYMLRLYKSDLYDDWLNNDAVPVSNGSITDDGTWERRLPAMEACWRYSPMGNNEGGWYMPSVAEMAYIISRAKAINTTISILCNAYGCEGSEIIASSGIYYLTSTEYISAEDSKHVSPVGIGQGICGLDNYTFGYVRPFRRISFDGDLKSSMDLGCDSIPTKLPIYIDVAAYDESVDTSVSRWCILREWSSVPKYCNGASSTSSVYPEGRIVSGKVYGTLVNGQYDFTVLQKDVELFSISDLEADYFDDEVESTGKNYGYYNNDVESGWYVIQKIICTDEDGKEYTIDNVNPERVTVGSILTDDDWFGYVSVCYKYPIMHNVYTDGYGDAPYNGKLCAFRAGYWNYKTVVYLHGNTDSAHDDVQDIEIPGEYEIPDSEKDMFIVPSFVYGRTAEWDSVGDWKSSDETNIVRTVRSGGVFKYECWNDDRDNTIGIRFPMTGSGGGDAADAVFVRFSSTGDVGEYDGIGARIELRLYKAVTDDSGNETAEKTPYNIIVLSDTHIVAPAEPDTITDYTYRDFFLNGSGNIDSLVANVSEDCYAEIALVVYYVARSASLDIEIHENSAYIIAHGMSVNEK